MNDDRPRVLYTSAEIRRAIDELYADSKPDDRRVAIVAFVGLDAQAFFPSPHNLHLICNPAPGSTNATALKRLMISGAKVEFSDKLHMKVFWSLKRGAVIGSANASFNALGPGGLREAGVFFPPGIVDIDRLIKSAGPTRKPTKSDFSKLEKFPVNRPGFSAPNQDKLFFDFSEWLKSPWLQPWRLGLVLS